jgi:hypothetical protein
MAKRSLSDAEILAQVAGARRRAQRKLRTEPHASRARFDKGQRALHVELTNGAAFEVPIDLVPVLADASDKELAEVEVGPAGVGLRWESLDTHLSVATLASAALGATVLLRAAGSLGGSARTRAKKRAARLNGMKGGRPRKTAA